MKKLATGIIEKLKSCVINKGYDQTLGFDFVETFSPVIKFATIRVILTLALSFYRPLKQIDIKNAFLNDILEEEVYIEQPRGFEDLCFPKYVYKLHKVIYGLKQAPRAWFDRLKSSFLQLGFVVSKADASCQNYILQCCIHRFKYEIVKTF